jgi:hypothetical protein
LTEKSIDASTAGTKAAGWKLFDYADLSSKNSIRARNRRTTLNTENRTYLTMLSSKHLSEAYSISENAAKGIFPLISKVQKNIPFDFMKIESLFGYGSFTRYQPYTQLQYTNSTVTKHLKKLWQISSMKDISVITKKELRQKDLMLKPAKGFQIYKSLYEFHSIPFLLIVNLYISLSYCNGSMTGKTG